MSSLPKTNLAPIKHIALDMDGTIYKGNTLFPFTISVLADLKKHGIRYSFLTNNSSKSRKNYLHHLTNIGISATPDEVYTSGQAAIDYLRYAHPDVKRLFILGTPGLIAEFEEAGFISTEDNPDDRPDAVMVGFDTSLTYNRLCRAAWWVHQKLPYIATNPDKVCPTDLPTVLVDCGSICAGIEKATGRCPDVVIGKPNPRMLDGIMHRYHLKPYEIAMVGDRLYTDIYMAHQTGALGVLVLTGEATEADLKDSPFQPDIVSKDLAQFKDMLFIHPHRKAQGIV